MQKKKEDATTDVTAMKEEFFLLFHEVKNALLLKGFLDETSDGLKCNCSLVYSSSISWPASMAKTSPKRKDGFLHLRGVSLKKNPLQQGKPF